LNFYTIIYKEGIKTMGVNLGKGGNVSLSKEEPGLKKILVGLGWDVRKTDGVEFDLDASLFMLANTGKVRSDNDFIFYNNLKSTDGSIEHTGDNRTGAGEGDDEVINIDLQKVPADVNKLVIGVSIHEADVRKQNFGMVDSAFIRVVNQDNNREIVRFDLSEEMSIETAMLFGEVYRHSGDWKLRAIGQGFKGGLGAMVKSYGINLERPLKTSPDHDERELNILLSPKELLEKSREQRNRKCYAESLRFAIVAAEKEPNNANASWLMALNYLSLGNIQDAISALKTTICLTPNNPQCWLEYGKVLLKTGDTKVAQDALERALKASPDHEETLSILAELYLKQNQNNKTVDERELNILMRLDDVSGLNHSQLNRIGGLHYRKENYNEAIKYWNRAVILSDEPVYRFNLGLAYNCVLQRADAIDMWRITAKYSPEFSRSNQQIAVVLPKLLRFATTVEKLNPTLLPKEQWFLFYLNPFQLINLTEENFDIGDIDIRKIQHLKKKMFQEIDLEEGCLKWLPGLTIDKSQAIRHCDELNNDDKKMFHWQVFKNKPLMEFLSRGSYQHFFVDAEKSPLDTICFLENEENGFLEWLSEPFAKQFDLILSSAIKSGKLIAIECLLNGRLWVSPSFKDRCFENTRKQVESLLESLVKATINIEDTLSTVESITEIIDRNNLIQSLNLLPNVHFCHQQNEIVKLIRKIAISCYNIHNNSNMSMQILQLTKRVNFKSADLTHQIEEDFKRLYEILL
jgi:stress response protein SCP2/tetratricopeptide (TPR) repeat protein